MNLGVGNHYDDDSGQSVSIWSIKVYSCSCYFGDYILWINSKDVKEAIFENYLTKCGTALYSIAVLLFIIVVNPVLKI